MMLYDNEVKFSLGLVDGRNEGMWMLYGKMLGQIGSENEQSKW